METKELERIVKKLCNIYMNNKEMRQTDIDLKTMRCQWELIDLIKKHNPNFKI